MGSGHDIELEAAGDRARVTDLLVDLDRVAGRHDAQGGMAVPNDLPDVCGLVAGTSSTPWLLRCAKPTSAPIASPNDAARPAKAVSGSALCTVILTRPRSRPIDREARAVRSAIAHRVQHAAEELPQCRLQRLVLDDNPTMPHIGVTPGGV